MDRRLIINNDELIYCSAAALAAQIRVGKLSSKEIVGACLARIEAVNPKINAVVQLDAGRALQQAEELDRLAARGEFKGVLHGVPITIKDSLDTAGIVSTGGTLGRQHYVPGEDAPVVARLRAAGAIVLGKSNTPELTLSAETNNLIYGRSSNPFDLTRSPGGSSGGAAAILACAGSALDLGSDTGGSIRAPAHDCGITGIKPTSGRTPRTGHIIPYGGGVLDSLTQIGPMARFVEDLILSLPIICGPDGRDPSVVPLPVNPADQVDLSSLRIAWYSDNGVVPVCDDIRRVLEQTAQTLSTDKLNLTHRLLPGMKQLVNLFTQLREDADAGLIQRLLKRYGSEAGPELQGYLNDHALAGAERFDPLLMEQIDEAKSQALGFFTDYDAILCPAAKYLARAHDASQQDDYDDWSYLTIHNLLGWPAVTVRAGSSETAGLPVGVQVVCAPWREDIALALAQRIESLMGGFQRPPI